MSRAGRPSERRRRELATGGRPRERLAEALASAHGTLTPGLHIVGVAHDEGCPAVEGRGMAACTCEIVEMREPVSVESLEDLRRYYARRRGA